MEASAKEKAQRAQAGIFDISRFIIYKSEIWLDL